MNASKSIEPATRNHILNKIQQLRNNFGPSPHKNRHRSAIARLADEIYSNTESPSKKKKPNHTCKTQSPLRNKKIKSHSKSSRSSKSSAKSWSSGEAMKGLEERTLCLSQLVQKNSNLLFQQKQLQQRIQFYKREIAAQRRFLNSASIKSKEHEDEIIVNYKRMKKKQESTKQVEEQSRKVRNQCLILEQEIMAKHQQNETVRQKIDRLRIPNQEISKFIRNQHNSIRRVAMESSQVKSSLRESMKRLSRQTIYKQQLSEQKAYLMIQANQIWKKVTHIVPP